LRATLRPRIGKIEKLITAIPRAMKAMGCCALIPGEKKRRLPPIVIKTPISWSPRGRSCRKILLMIRTGIGTSERARDPLVAEIVFSAKNSAALPIVYWKIPKAESCNHSAFVRRGNEIRLFDPRFITRKGILNRKAMK